MGHPICMRVVTTEATGNTGSVVVQRLCAEGTHDPADPVRRMPEGPDGRGADRRSVDLSTDACHGALAEVVGGMRRAASGGTPVWRPRTVRGAPGGAGHRGPVTVRRLP